MPRRDPLRILDAVYAFELDDAAWMRALLEATLPFSLGMGVAGYIAEIGEVPGTRAVTMIDTTMTVELVANVMASLPEALWKRIHAPMPANRNVDMIAGLEAEGFDIGAMSSLTPGQGLYHCWGALGGDLGIESALVCIPCEPRARLQPAVRHILDFTAAHVGSALRLRRLLGRTPKADDATTEAVISPDGRVLDARGARAKESLPSIVDAVRTSERARSRKADPGEGFALWTALVEGRWSIVRTEERDGKRMLLACRNEPRTSAIRRLSTRERSVAQYAALGHPYKYIAYELGISVSSVAATLKDATRKLGLRSRTELIQTFGLAGPSHERFATLKK